MATTGILTAASEDWTPKITNAYKNVYGSTPTQDNINYWTNKLNTAPDRNAVYDEFLQQGKNTNQQANYALTADQAVATPLSTPTSNGGLLGSPNWGVTNNGNAIATGPALVDPNTIKSDIANAYAPSANIDLSKIAAPQYSAVDVGQIGNVTAGTAQATLATPTVQGYTADKMTVNNDMLVENRLNSIINKDNPLMQSARTAALQGMNSRGLLNSSMAGEAAQKAVIDSAMPIAQQDAETYRIAAKSNQDAENEARQFVAQAQNQRDIDNAKLATEVSLQNVKMQLDAAIANQDNARTVMLENAKNNLTAQLAVYSANVQAETANAQMQNNLNIAQGNAMSGTLSDIIQGNQAATNSWNQLNSNQQFQLQQSYNGTMTGLNTWANSQYMTIQNSDMPEDQKNAAYQNVQTVVQNSADMNNALFSSSPQWSKSFATINITP